MGKNTRTFYVADLHLRHRTMPKFEAAVPVPWAVPATVEERDEVIIRNWNATISKNDTVWLLGDVAYAPEAEFISLMRKLNGHKRIVMGNHDKSWMWRLNETHKGDVVSVCDYAKVSDDGRKVVLSHYPIAFWDGQHKGAYHVYGHVHGTDEERLFQEFGKSLVEAGHLPEFRAVNAGIMVTGYVPKTLDQLIEGRGFQADADFG